MRLGNVYSDNMAANDNSVNIKTYHHGDLRSALIEEGLRLLALSDAEHLSLREIARNVGVSATAVYRHFPDKQALLSALAQRGGDMLAEQQMQAQTAAGGGVAGFDATGRTYVRFALAHPALFRLMMARTRADALGTPDDVCLTGLGLLRQNVAALAEPGTSNEEQRVRAVFAWAIVHGLAMLMLDGQVPAEDALIDQVVKSASLHANPVSS